MCDQAVPDSAAVARMAPRLLGDAEVDPVALEPVDRVWLTTLVDNVSDLLLLDQGPAKRFGVLSLAGMPRVPEPLFEQGETGRGTARRARLFDAGHRAARRASGPHRLRHRHDPDGMADNMRRFSVDAGDVEVVVLSHGHFDHSTGLDGFVGPWAGRTSRWLSTLACGPGGAWPSPGSTRSRSPP